MMARRFMNLTLAAAALMLVAGTAAAKDAVVIAEPNWTGATAIAHILKATMDQYLDTDAQVVAIDSTVAFTAMDKGDGSVDVYPDFWSQHRHSEWSQFVAPGSRETIRVNAQPYKGTEGIFITAYTASAHSIRRIEDLADPEVAKLFDTDGDGVGEYWPGGPGWNATDHNLVRFKSYGLDTLYEPFVVEQWVMEAKLDGAIKRELPALFYFWTPEWIHAAYDLTKLEEAPFTGFANETARDNPAYNPEGCYDFVQATDDPNWLEKSSITCQEPEVDVYVAHSKAMAERLPKVAQFLNQVSFTPEMVNGWILSLAQEKRDPAEMAKEWIAENKELVETQWLAGVI